MEGFFSMIMMLVFWFVAYLVFKWMMEYLKDMKHTIRRIADALERIADQGGGNN